MDKSVKEHYEDLFEDEDLGKFKDAKQVKVKVKYKDGDKDKDEFYVYMVKMGGKWYCLNR